MGRKKVMKVIDNKIYRSVNDLDKKKVVKNNKCEMTDENVVKFTDLIMRLSSSMRYDPSFDLRTKKIEAIKFAMEVIAKI